MSGQGGWETGCRLSLGLGFRGKKRIGLRARSLCQTRFQGKAWLHVEDQV